MPINYKDYPPNWSSEIVPRIKERAGHKCEHCGISNYTVKANGTKVILTIAHLDHDAKNHAVSDDRLAALCQKCHLAYDMHRHVRKRKYGADIYKMPTLFECAPAPEPVQVPAPPLAPAFTRADFEAAYNIYTLYQRGDLHYFQHSALFEYAVEAGWLTLCTSNPEKQIYLYERKS